MDKVIKLERIYNGNLEIKAGIEYDLSELEEITGSCDIYSDGKFKANKNYFSQNQRSYRGVE